MQSRAMFNKAFLQAVLLYRGERWVLTDSTVKVVEGFYHCISCRIAGKTACRIRTEVWEWPPVEESLEAAGVWPMREYTRRHQATIEDYIAKRLIYDMCIGAEHFQGKSRLMRLWDKDHSWA